MSYMPSPDFWADLDDTDHVKLVDRIFYAVQDIENKLQDKGIGPGLSPDARRFLQRISYELRGCKHYE